MFGASIAAPLAMPPTVHPSPSTATVFGTVSVVMIARGGVGRRPSGCAPAATAGIPVAQRRRVERDADEAGGAHEHVLGRRRADGRRR